MHKLLKYLDLVAPNITAEYFHEKWKLILRFKVSEELKVQRDLRTQVRRSRSRRCVELLYGRYQKALVFFLSIWGCIAFFPCSWLGFCCSIKRSRWKHLRLPCLTIATRVIRKIAARSSQTIYRWKIRMNPSRIRTQSSFSRDWSR